MWDWAGPKDYLHDEISTDRRDPRVNANGPIYGATEESTDLLPVLDPVAHAASQLRMPVRDPKTPSSKELSDGAVALLGRGADLGQPDQHPQSDDGREGPRLVHLARPAARESGVLPQGLGPPVGEALPARAREPASVDVRPGDQKFTLISTCFPTHHLVFAEDANHTLWTSAGGPASGVVGWLNRKLFEETGDERKAQGWTALILDTNGNGKRDGYVEPDQPIDPAKDTRVVAALYSVAVNPVDGTVWGTSLGFPGRIVRLDPGQDPPATALAEVYEPPFPGYGPRGGDIDRNGVFWASLSSGHLASFDRRQCKGPLNGPDRDRQALPRGLDALSIPRTAIRDRDGRRAPPRRAITAGSTSTTSSGSAGTCRSRPAMPTSRCSRSSTGSWINLRVPYPLGFYAKWMDARIDDRGGRVERQGAVGDTSTRAPFHMEGGKGTRPKVVKFQLRPDPLAR